MKMMCRKMCKRVLPVMLALLLSCSCVLGSYMDVRAMSPGTIYTAGEIVGSLLGLFGIGVGVDAVSNPDKYREALDGMVDKVGDFAKTYEKWKTKTEVEIALTLNEWWDYWKTGAGIISDEMMDFFRSFAGEQYKSMNVNLSGKKVTFEPGEVIGYADFVLDETTYKYRYICLLYVFNTKCKAVMCKTANGVYSTIIVPIQKSGQTPKYCRFLIQGYEMHRDLVIKEIDNELKAASSCNPTTSSISIIRDVTPNFVAEKNWNSDDLYFNNLYYYGELGMDISDFVPYLLNGISDDWTPGVPASNVKGLSDALGDVYERDKGFANYDVIDNQNVIGADGTVTGERAVTLAGADVLAKVAAGEMTWAEYMAYCKALGIDVSDGITADTPIVGEDDKTIGGYVPTPVPPPVPTPGDSFTADLKKLFPFCIPFDLVRAIQCLDAEPVAPVFKMPFKIDYRNIHIDEKWELDFADYESPVKIFRLIETLGFIIGLIIITRNIIKG